MHHLKFPEEHSPDTSRAFRRYKEQWLRQQWGIGLYILEKNRDLIKMSHLGAGP